MKNESGEFHFSSHWIFCQYGKLELWEVLEKRSASSHKGMRGSLLETLHGHLIRQQVKTKVKVKVQMNKYGSKVSRIYVLLYVIGLFWTTDRIIK